MVKKVNRINSLFFELLQVALDKRESLSECPTSEDWDDIYEIAKMQALVGVCFYAVERLPQEQLPPLRRLRQWAVMAIKLEAHNKRVNQECNYVSDVFLKSGFYSFILKGQSVLKYYDTSLRLLRNPGDVDVWIIPCQKLRERFACRKKKWIERYLLLDDFYIIAKYVKSISKHMDDIVYHHLHCNILKNNLVEVHITPSFSMNPFDNRRLQKLYQDMTLGVDGISLDQCREGFNSLPLGINIIFLISHFYRHLITEGVGMRQLMDIYFVLKAYIDEANRNEDGLSNLTNLKSEIDRTGLHRITSAIMWTLQDRFGMSDEYLICKPSEKFGKHLLKEMLAGGNFGHSSEEAQKMYSGRSSVIRFYRFCIYGMRLIRYYPREAFWVPFNNFKQSIIKNYYRRNPIH